MTLPGPSAADVPPIEDWSRLLAGRIAVVTGGGAGIGEAICGLFAQHGAHVVLADVDEPAAAATAAQISSTGGSATWHRVDVPSPTEVRGFAAEVLAERP